LNDEEKKERKEKRKKMKEKHRKKKRKNYNEKNMKWYIDLKIFRKKRIETEGERKNRLILK
jgi:hypothetical protein